MRPAVLLAAIVLVLSACGGESSPTEVGADGQVIGTGTVADLDFSGTTPDGAPFEGTVLQGRTTVLWFWAPWCPTCRAQIPNLTQLAEKYDGEVTVVGVGGLDDEAAIRSMSGDIPHLTHLIDAEGEIWKHFDVTAQSTYTVIGSDGEIKAEGYLDDDELNTLVEQLAD